MDPDVYERLVTLAEANYRSATQQACWLIKEALPPTQPDRSPVCRVCWRRRGHLMEGYAVTEEGKNGHLVITGSPKGSEDAYVGRWLCDLFEDDEVIEED